MAYISRKVRDQAGGDRDEHDQRAAPGVQEEEQDDAGDDDREDEVLLDGVDGVGARKRDVSLVIVTSTPGGSVRRDLAQRRRARLSAVSSVLASDCLVIDQATRVDRSGCSLVV